MLISLIDPTEIERANQLKTVDSPILFNRNGIPERNGLLSNEIFGLSVKERKSTYAIIDLNHMMITPHIYKIVSQSLQIIPKIVLGAINVRLDENNRIIQDTNGSTGIDWLYSNWDKINFSSASTSTIRRDEKIQLLSMTDKKKTWIDRILVIPPGYREISTNDSKSVSSSELNKIYIDIIRIANQVADASQLMITSHRNIYMLQTKLAELYDYCKSKIEKKTGYIKQALFSKTTDYGVRSVISCGVYNQQSINDQPVKYPQCEIALSQVLVGFLPFVKKYIYDYINKEFISTKNLVEYLYSDEKDPNVITQYKRYRIYDPYTQFSPENIDKMIDNFIRYPEMRFRPFKLIMINDEKHKIDVNMKFIGKHINKITGTKLDESRKFTFTDLMYLAAFDASYNKHCVVTRYPILTYLNTILQEIVVGSTIKTAHMTFNNIEYNRYPHVELDIPEHEVPSRFMETSRFSNALLGPMGADYDGDQTTVKCLWSVEANAEAHRLIYDKKQFVGFDGDTLKKVGNEIIQTIYMMTR